MTQEAGWTHESLGLPPTANTTIDGFAPLLAGGFPFVKRFLLDQRRFAQFHEPIAQVVRQEYGAELH